MFHALLYMALAGVAQAGVWLEGAEHRGSLTGTVIRWESRAILSYGEAEELPLVSPLGPEVRLVELRGADPILAEDGGLAGLRPWPGVAELELVVDQPLAAASASEPEDDHLAAPIFQADGYQRISLYGVDWEPDPALGLQARLRHTMPPELSTRERRAIDRRLDGRRRGAQPHVYVLGDARMAGLGGLPGAVRPAGRVPVGVVAGTGAIFLGLVGCGVLGHRLLEVQARRERLDAYMNDEFVQAELRRKGQGSDASPVG